jgi:hypothetical protein
MASKWEPSQRDSPSTEPERDARTQSQSKMLEHGARAEASLDILIVRDKDIG